MTDKLLNDLAMDWLDQNQRNIIFRQWHMHVLDNLTRRGTKFQEQLHIAKPQVFNIADGTREFPPARKVEIIVYHLITLRMRFGLIPDNAAEIFATALINQIPPVTEPFTPNRFYLSKIYSEMKDGIIYWRAYYAHCDSMNERSDRP